ncbi:aconitase X swivel domain-containing protein [Citricoccus parietis]|uniref:Aconitase X swivel domain-containing protein n=2 Tax=Citricoccus parietis TaxID=592307 RepID=A0ABV5FY82_9MICC
MTAAVRGTGRVLVDGVAEGELLVCTRAISGWGGIDPGTGAIVETSHPQRGAILAGKVVVMPGAKGSSGWSGQFHIAKLQGTAPAAIMTETINSKLALGLAVLGVPALIDIDPSVREHLLDGRWARIEHETLTVWSEGEQI